MPDYSKGKIYKIVDNTNDNIYIGSTTQELKKRLNDHRQGMNCKCSEIIKNNNYKIELLEYYPCNNRQELELREGEYIRNNKCINKQIPGRTQKEYREFNKEKIKEWRKEYLELNKENIKKQQIDYYQNNKDKILENSQNYRNNNIEYCKLKDKLRNEYFKSMGGKPYNNNMSLLKIDINLFQ